MPPPNCCDKVNTRSALDQGNENCFENSKSEISNSEQDFKLNLRSETVGIVKSFLGPSLEDAVLRTLEFGKSLMQKPDLDIEQISREKKLFRKYPKEITGCSNKDLEVLLEERKKGTRGYKNCCDDREKNLLVLASKLGKEDSTLSRKPTSSTRKLSNLSKIRSLDSDLKQSSPSPEKIKKQLEALIQINKDEPPEHSWNIVSAKTPKIPVEMTVMPSLCVYKNETDMNYSSSCDIHSQTSKAGNDCSESSRPRCAPKKRHPNKICQAPEFLSNALGPTIDVSIIDNLKMMRDIFKYDSGKGECLKEPPPMNQQIKQEIRLQNSEAEMTCRIEELQRKIEELEQKEQCLIKQIEEEDHERECRRRAFEDEEQRLKCLSEQMKCMDTLSEGRKRDAGKTLSMECNFDAKYEALRTRVAAEEEKLSRLKCQHDQYKRELMEAKSKAEALKRNKCLLDAWDIFASRVCHTRLPSFSRAFDLERKEFKSNDPVNLHCCFPTLTNPPESPKSCCTRNSSRIKFRNENKSESQVDICTEHTSQAHVKCKMKMGEIQFPIQRDISCGLHQMLKTCCCSSKTAMRIGAQLASSDDDLLKKCRGTRASFNNNYSSSLGVESSAEILLRDASGDKHACRSKSDTSLKNDKCSKIVKVMWAVTRINIFQNNYRTYEIMDATCNPPPCAPAKTEGIFVVKTPQKKWCESTPRRCSPCTTEFH